MTCRIPRATSPAISSGAFGQLPGSHTAPDTLAHSSIVRLADHQSSRMGQPNLAAASERGPFIQAVLDVLTVCYWLFLALLSAGAVCAAIFTLGWFIFFYL